MSRVSQAQMKKLLDLLCEDGILINGKVAYTNTNKQTFWKRVALQLNAVEGGVYKNTWKWCKMWADWKNKTKKKANIILRRKNYSLEHPSPTLSALERRLLSLINYPLDDKTDAIRLEMVAKMEPTEKPDNFNMEFLNEDYNDLHTKEKSSSDDEDKGSNCFDKNESKFCDVNAIVPEDTFEGLGEASDLDHKVKLKRKSFKKKKLSLEEYKVKTTLNLEKDRVQQKNEELRLRALELKLKGEELRLKEIEMNKINYLTNIEEEKLKCFRDISSSLKELLERSRSGNLRFHNAL
ncbi:unnamed protein product [Arctia plantaginis]|uniref:Regulatory protein zeste n=1 Tax=Arctia plantaginis TaxID=874455 RepID=A0A8S1AL12_ARCPL|nr:unnamed protein product [Arctia plantaginis]